jgi:hypothetical protein
MWRSQFMCTAGVGAGFKPALAGIVTGPPIFTRASATGSPCLAASTVPSLRHGVHGQGIRSDCRDGRRAHPAPTRGAPTSKSLLDMPLRDMEQSMITMILFF